MCCAVYSAFELLYNVYITCRCFYQPGCSINAIYKNIAMLCCTQACNPSAQMLLCIYMYWDWRGNLGRVILFCFISMHIMLLYVMLCYVIKLKSLVQKLPK